MAFEADHNLKWDGIAGPDVWAALLEAVAHRQVTTTPYDYVSVSQALPESATVWRNGQNIFTTPVNTGIAAAPTAVGTYPVYARYVVTTMTGKNPDGTPYSDPGIPWVSYFNGGDALHGYIRASYGFPQSLGCVEMTYANAATMFPLTPIGTLVTVLPS
jgi:lipoprotein-anchoring transpeptidase ErfK/SrfK